MNQLPKDTNLFSAEAEQGVLGAALLDFQRVIELCEVYGVTVDHFVEGRNRIVFETMQAFRKSGKAFDTLTLTMHMSGVVEPSGYAEILIDKTPTAAHAEFYIQELCDRKMRRDGVSACKRYGKQFLLLDHSPEMTRGEMECKMAALAKNGKDSEQSKKESINEMAVMFDAALANGCAGIKTPFKFWNTNFGGLMPKILFVVSGNPGCFKTTLVRNVLAYVSGVHGLRTDFLTLEQGKGQIYASMIAQQAGVNLSTLIAGRSREDRQKWEDARKEVESWPCVVDDKPQTASSLWSRARQAKNAGSVCLAVDYLQYIQGDDARMNEEQRIAKAVEACRMIAKELSIPVIAIASQNYAGTLRGSGQIEYAAVNWMQMEKWETPDKSSVIGAHLRIAKSRYSQQFGQIPMWHKRGSLLEEPPITPHTVEAVQNMEDEI